MTHNVSSGTLKQVTKAIAGRLSSGQARYVSFDNNYASWCVQKQMYVVCRHSFHALAGSIKRLYREDMRHVGPVTFREFVQYVIDLADNEQSFNQHWNPMYKICQPCRIHYDFIGHTETMAEDSRYVLSRLGIDVDLFPHHNVHNSSDRVTEALAQLTKSEMRRLIEIYRPDFDLFGYSVNI